VLFFFGQEFSHEWLSHRKKKKIIKIQFQPNREQQQRQKGFNLNSLFAQPFIILLNYHNG